MKIFSFKNKPHIIVLTACGCLFFFLLSIFIKNIADKKVPPKPDTFPQENEGENASHFTKLNDAILTRLIIENLSDSIPLSNLIAHIDSDGTITIDCTVDKQSITTFLDEKNLGIPTALKLVTKLFPETVPVSLKLRLALESQSGSINMRAQSITINNIEFSGEMLPTNLEIKINQAINNSITDKDKKIESITLSDGHIIINLIEK